MKNTFAARERQFVTELGEDLHLSLRWDEFDEDDNNLVTWALPGSDLDPPPPEDDESSDDEEAHFAVDRVLNKYERAPVWDENEDGGFDARHARAVREKMDDWKRDYYKVCPFSPRCR
jgi:5'-3' exoribonuclease 1